MSSTSKTADASRRREVGFSKDADKLIRRLSLVAFLLTRQNRPVRAEQIRRRVEGYALMTDDAFKRRFYEDRGELDLLGIAIASEPDEELGGELYSLPAAAYYLPAIDLTHEELLALGSCLLVLEGRFAYSRPLRLALLSLAQGRPELLQQDVVPPLSILTDRQTRRAAGHLPRLQTAVADRKTVVFDYYTISRDELAERTVDPYGLLLVGDEWYLVGRCHRRGRQRTFRLSRIRSRVRYATRRPHDFTVPEDISLADLRGRPPWQLDAGGATATIRVSERMAWWVAAHYAHCGAIEQDGDGGIVYSTRFSAARPLVSWVLGLGAAAEIVSPQSMRDMACEQLSLLLERLDDPPPDPLAGRPRKPGRTGDRAGGRGARSGAPSAVARHDEWHVEVDRFTRLTALASYLLAHCGGDGTADLPVEQVCGALGTTPAELRADVRLLNLVNFGGEGGLLYADFKHRRLAVQCDLAGQALARPARLSPLQADTLLLAVELVGGQMPTTAAGALRSAAEKVRAARHGPPPAVQAGPMVAIGDDIMSLVNTAIREHRLLRIEYWSEGRDELTVRAVEPYLILRQRGEWYTVCYCRRSRAVRTFRLATMKSAHIDEERFRPRSDIQIDLYRHEGIPASSEYAPLIATVWYSPDVARWVAEREAVEPLTDGGCVSAQPYVDTPWLVHTVLRFGGQAVPLAPADAVAAVAAAARALRARYVARAA